MEIATTKRHLPLIAFRAAEMAIDWDSVIGANHLYRSTLTEIKNAWRRHAVVDTVGHVWVALDGIKSILRLSKRGKADRYLVDHKVREVDKRYIGQQLYIKGTVIGQMIDENVQGGRSFRKRDYSSVSQSLYLQLVRHPMLENLRARASEEYQRKHIKLKSQRENRYRLKTDELTGKRLWKTCQFSHIRSVACYPEIAICFWNGLLVNPETHEMITRHDIQNERQLLRLCKEQQWSTRWTEPFAIDLRKQGYSPLI